MRPTIERAYWSRDFETAKARKACTEQGRGIATGVTKSGVRGCRPRQGRGWRAERELVVTEEVEVEGKTAMDLYTTLGTLGPPACSLKVRSSSDGLGRPRGLGGQLRE